MGIIFFIVPPMRLGSDKCNIIDYITEHAGTSDSITIAT